MNIKDDENPNPPGSEATPSVESTSPSQPAPEAASNTATPQPTPTPSPSSHSDEVPGPFIAGTDERCLWIDPLGEDLRVKAGAVLLGDVIDQYVKGFNVLFDNRTGYDNGKLKGGSYTMTPDENDAWIFLVNATGHVEKRPLDKERDVSGEYYIVPRNSLVYIKLKQTLRLPLYIIGRHNLKIRYVYKGLLLGTGPQVDPGFQGNLFIPLHNFTTSNAKVYINGKESSFVSIDFVRTTPFLGEIKIPAHIRTLDELREHLKAIGSRVLIEKKKVAERRELEDYLEGDKPRSQLAQFQSNYERFEHKVRSDHERFEQDVQSKYDLFTKDVRRDLEESKKWARIEILAIVVLIITALGYFLTYVAEVRTQVKEARTLVEPAKRNSFESRISFLETNSSQSLDRLSNQLASFMSSSAVMASNIAQLQTNLKSVDLRLMQYPKGSTNASATNTAVGKVGP